METVLYAVVLLGGLIAFHEFGHFVFAKMFGVGVHVFSIGFGPKLLHKKIGETEYTLSLVPLGGYVKMEGEGEASDSEKSFSAKAPWKRILIIVAGALFNFLLGFTLITSSYLVDGVPIVTTKVGVVAKDSPAEQAGILAGDKIIAINGKSVKNWEEFSKIMTKKADDHSVELSVERGSGVFKIVVSPRVVNSTNIFGETIKKRAIGIQPGEIVKERGGGKAFMAGAEQATWLSWITIVSVGKMIQNKISSDNIGGAISVVQGLRIFAKISLGALLFFAGIISLSLFVLNLLPIPVLDGGHLPFLAIEWVRGKPVKEETIKRAQFVGIALLVMVFLLGT